MTSILIVDSRPAWRRFFSYLYEVARGIRPWRGGHPRFRTWAEMMRAYHLLGVGPKEIWLYGSIQVPLGNYEFEPNTTLRLKTGSGMLQGESKRYKFKLASELEGDEP